jgi:hypothetical protein
MYEYEYVSNLRGPSFMNNTENLVEIKAPLSPLFHFRSCKISFSRTIHTFLYFVYSS